MPDSVFFIFVMISAADKVIEPHVLKTHLTTWLILSLCVQNIYIEETRSVLIWQSLSVLLRCVLQTCCFLFVSFIHTLLWVKSIFLLYVLWKLSFPLFKKFWQVKTTVSHEYFMRNKRKYLLINSVLEKCIWMWLILSIIPRWLIYLVPLNILSCIISNFYTVDQFLVNMQQLHWKQRVSATSVCCLNVNKAFLVLEYQRH